MENLNIEALIHESKKIANEQAIKFFNEKLDGKDQYACGFAWVSIYGIRANSKVGKQLQALGLKKEYGEKAFVLWNPSDLNVQNIDTKEEGANACAKFLQKYGFRAYVGSRLD
jgi:hypothetical protein